MSLDLEDRISAELRSRPTHVSDPSLDDVRMIARRRSIRSRVAVAACGLITLAGAASFIPMNDEASSLITATDPTPVEDQKTPEPSEGELPVVTADRTPAGRPPPYRVVADGHGGFAAIAVTTSDGRTSFVRSDDGEEWYDGGEVQLTEDRFMSQLQFVDGSFVAVVDEYRPASTTSSGFLNPHIAISEDLIDWEIMDLRLGNDARTKRYWITDVAMSRTDIAVNVRVSEPLDHARYGLLSVDICGLSRTPASSTVTRCTGEVISVEANSIDSFRSGDGVFLISRRGQPFQEVDQPYSTIDEFDLVGSRGAISSIGRGIVDPRTWEDWTTNLDDTEVDLEAPVESRTTTTNTEGEAVTLVRQGDRIAAVWHTSRENNTAFLPESVMLSQGTIEEPRIAHGPAGWVALISDEPSQLFTVEEDDWQLSGVANSIPLVLEKLDGTEAHWFSPNSIGVPPYVERSAFGAIRFFRPGTDELLVEIPSGSDQRSPLSPFSLWFDAAPSHHFDQELTVDGWTLSGDPLRGPLTLSSPSGDASTFGDGFAFTNDDPTDGVELVPGELGIGIYSLAFGRGDLAFFAHDDASILVQFSSAEIFESLVLPLIGEPNGNGGFVPPPLGAPVPHAAWLVHSPDGIEWEILREMSGLNINTRTQLAVGDAEILLLDPSGVTRIELDE